MQSICDIVINPYQSNWLAWRWQNWHWTICNSILYDQCNVIQCWKHLPKTVRTCSYAQQKSSKPGQHFLPKKQSHSIGSLQPLLAGMLWLLCLQSFVYDRTIPYSSNDLGSLQKKPLHKSGNKLQADREDLYGGQSRDWWKAQKAED